MSAAPKILDEIAHLFPRASHGVATAVEHPSPAAAFRAPGEGWMSAFAKRQAAGFGVSKYRPYLAPGQYAGATRPQFTVPEVAKSYLTHPIKTFRTSANEMGPLDIGFLGLTTASSLPELKDPNHRGEAAGRLAGMAGGWVGLPHHLPIIPQLALWQIAETVGGRLGKMMDRPAPPVGY